MVSCGRGGDELGRTLEEEVLAAFHGKARVRIQLKPVSLPAVSLRKRSMCLEVPPGKSSEDFLVGKVVGLFGGLFLLKRLHLALGF